MMSNPLFKLTLLSISTLFVHPSHAMLMRHTVNRSGTKYVTQLAQTAQKRWLETENKNVSQLSHRQQFIGNYLVGAIVGTGTWVGFPMALKAAGFFISAPHGKDAMKETWSGLNEELAKHSWNQILFGSGFLLAGAAAGPAGFAGYATLVAAPYAIYKWNETKLDNLADKTEKKIEQLKENSIK